MTTARPSSTMLRSASASLALALGALGCGGPASSVDDASTGPLYSCTAETRAVAYAPDLTRASTSGAYKAILLQSTPAPPARGTDTWTVKVVDANDVAQDGLTMTASPFMPDHGHPSTIKPVVMPLGSGEYSMTPLYLYMPGYWEITLTLKRDADGGAPLDVDGGPPVTDSVMFPICIPG